MQKIHSTEKEAEIPEIKQMPGMLPAPKIIDQDTEEWQFDCCGRRIKWYLKKAQIANAPTIVILHGQGYNAQPARFSNSNWNVVCPMDNFGYENMGSWFLGEKGDFFGWKP